MHLAVRVRGDPERFIPRLRTIATETDPRLRIYDARVLSDLSQSELEFIAFWIRDDMVVAGMNMNVWDVTDPIQRLIREGRRYPHAWVMDAGGEATDDPARGVLSTHIHSDGRLYDLLYVDGGPSSTGDAGVIKMEGKDVFKHAVTRMPQAIMEGMQANGIKSIEQIDMMIPHQANLRINQMVAQMIGMPADKTHNNIQKYGNTTAASIPICMHEAIELGKIKPGNLVCLVAFGIRLTTG